MARTAGEEVTISSIQFTERELPLWATEKTHQKLLSILAGGRKNNETLLKNIDQNIASLASGLSTNADELADQTDAINNLIDTTRNAQDEENNNNNQSNSLLKWLGSRFEATGREITDVIKPTFLSFRLPDVSRIMRAFGTDLVFSGKHLSKFAGVLPLLIGIIGSLVTRLFDTHEVFRSLTEVGVDFNSVLATGGDRLLSFGQAAAQSTLTIQEFSALLTKFSRVAARVGERNFGMLNREVANLLRPMGMLGLRVEELGEFTGNYLERQRLLGMLQVNQQQNQAEAIARNVQMLTAFSRVTGVARKQMEQTIDRAVTEAEFVAFLNSLPPEIRANMERSVTTAVAGLSAVLGERAEALTGPLMDVMRRGFFATERSLATLQALAPTIAPAFMDFANTIKTSDGNIEAVNEGLITFMGSIGTLSDNQFAHLGRVVDATGDQFAKELIMIAAELRSAGAGTEEFNRKIREAGRATVEQEGRARDLADGINLWQDTLKRLRLLWDDIIFRFLGLPGVGNKVKEALGFLEGNIDKVVKKLLSIADEVFPAIEAAFKRFEAWFSGFFVGGVFQKEKFQVEISNIVRSGMNTVLASIWDAMLTAIKNWAAAPFRAAGEAIGEEIFDLVHGQGKAGEAAAVEAAGRRGDLGLGKPPKEETAGVGEQLSNALGDVKSDITNALTGSKKPGGRGMILESPRLIPAPTTPPNRTEPEPPGFFARMKNTLGFGNAAVAAEPVRTPLETRRQEEQEENIGPRNNRNTANMTLNTGNPTAEITEALLRETTDLLRTMIEMDNRQVKLLQENRDETRRLQQGLY